MKGGVFLSHFIGIRSAAASPGFPLSYHALRLGIKQGRFPYVIAGHRYLVDPEQVQEILAAEALENQAARKREGDGAHA